MFGWSCDEMTDFRDDFSVCQLVLCGVLHVLFFSGSFPVACDHFVQVCGIHICRYGIFQSQNRLRGTIFLYCYIRQHGCF